MAGSLPSPPNFVSRRIADARDEQRASERWSRAQEDSGEGSFRSPKRVKIHTSIPQ
jgi:hypothetical protein